MLNSSEHHYCLTALKLAHKIRRCNGVSVRGDLSLREEKLVMMTQYRGSLTTASSLRSLRIASFDLFRWCRAAGNLVVGIQ